MLQDLRFCIRRLAGSPGFFLLVVLTLALGIGANLTIFSVASAVVLSPLPYDQPDRLVAIWEANLPEGKDHERVAPPNFEDYRGLTGAFEDAAAWWRLDMNLADHTGESLRVSTVECTANLFAVLGVSPHLGPGFEQVNPLYSQDLAAVISFRLWRDRYSNDPAVISKKITLNGLAYTVVGVMGPGFRFPGNDIDVWQRQSWDFSIRTRFAHFMEAIGRLRPDVTLAQAQSDLAALSNRLGQEHPASNASWRARVIPLHSELVGDYGPALSILMAAVGLLLLLACANVANLLLVRANSREPEMAVRAAVGAPTGRLLRLALTEGALLGVCAAALGLAMTFGAVRLLLAIQPLDIPRLTEVSFNGQVVAFGSLLALLTTLVLGAIPAFQLRRPDVRMLLQDAGAAGARAGRMARRARTGLAVFEVALAMTLLVGTILLIRSVGNLLEQEPGFVPDDAVTIALELPATLYPDWIRVSRFYGNLLEQLDAHPAIGSVGATSFLPLTPAWIVGYTVPGRPPEVAGETLRAHYVTITPGYFETLRVPLLAGRHFNSRDTASSLSAVLINEQMAMRTWSSPAEAVGKVIHIGTRGFGPLGRAFKESRGYEIIGVVADVKNNGLTSPSDPAVFFVATQFPYRTMNLVVSGQGTGKQLLPAVREVVKRLDPGLPLARVRTLDEVLAQPTARARFVTGLMSSFAGLAVMLAAIGIYGVLSYAVRLRRYELAVRLSLGASPGDLQRQVLREGMLVVAFGLILGGVLALALSQLMRSLLFGVSATDPLTFTAAALAITAASLAASTLPARHASQVDPVEALRTP